MTLTFAKRQYYGNNNCYQDAYGRVRCYNNAWGNWARWLLLGLILLGATLIFFLFSCFSARRRRKLGYQPYRGTGWTLGRTPPGHAPAQYTGAQVNNQNQYNAQPYYNNSNAPPPTYGVSDNHYGGRDVEMQTPAAAHTRKDDQTYQPPVGPPPGRSY